MRTQEITATWSDHGTVTEFRPTGYRLTTQRGLLPVAAVAPCLTVADPEWKSKVGSLQWQTSAESFNRNVGWKVAYWHWSVVENGRVLGAGDELTVEAAKGKAELALPARILRHLTVV